MTLRFGVFIFQFSFVLRCLQNRSSPVCDNCRKFTLRLGEKTIGTSQNQGPGSWSIEVTNVMIMRISSKNRSGYVHPSNVPKPPVFTWRGGFCDVSDDTDMKLLEFGL